MCTRVPMGPACGPSIRPSGQLSPAAPVSPDPAALEAIWLWGAGPAPSRLGGVERRLQEGGPHDQAGLGLRQDRGAGCHLSLSVRTGVSDLRRKPSLRPFPAGTVSPMAPPGSTCPSRSFTPAVARPCPAPSAGAVVRPVRLLARCCAAPRRFLYSTLVFLLL